MPRPPDEQDAAFEMQQPVLMKDTYVTMMASGKPVEATLDQDMFKSPVESRR